MEKRIADQSEVHFQYRKIMKRKPQNEVMRYAQSNRDKAFMFRCAMTSCFGAGLIDTKYFYAREIGAEATSQCHKKNPDIPELCSTEENYTDPKLFDYNAEQPPVVAQWLENIKQERHTSQSGCRINQ